MLDHARRPVAFRDCVCRPGFPQDRRLPPLEERDEMSVPNGSADKPSHAAMPIVICLSGGLCNRLLHIATAVRELMPMPR